MSTVTLDQIIAALRPLFGEDGSAPTPVPVPAPSQPQTISVLGYQTHAVRQVWATTVGSQSTRTLGGFRPGDAYVFVLRPPNDYSSHGKMCSFRVSPTDADGYIMRAVSLSDTPGDYSRKLAPGSVKFGTDLRIYFSVGGHPVDKYGRQDTDDPDLIPGREYYVTVLNRDAGGTDTSTGVSADINYALTVA